MGNSLYSTLKSLEEMSEAEEASTEGTELVAEETTELAIIEAGDNCNCKNCSCKNETQIPE